MTRTTSQGDPPTLRRVLDVLGDLAPLRWAGEWDNVGLLVDPPTPGGWGRTIRRVALTIDLTEGVLAEALEAGADLVVAYHPPIFKGLKRLVAAEPKHRIVMDAIRAGVPVYSPHTALDAAPGGLNDWLLKGLGETREPAPIEPVEEPPEGAVAGAGRTARLSEPTDLPALVRALKAHLGLEYVRVAAPAALREGEGRISRVAVCPGAGGSLFAGLEGPDLYVTGEMRHHDVLARVAAGAAVVLTDHTNTERGYLPVLRERLSAALGDGVAIDVSVRDADPLRVT
ncbi:MAG: Nif3-like dinuclear metal center hexameric protein [Myxococcota bacterium]